MMMIPDDTIEVIAQRLFLFQLFGTEFDDDTYGQVAARHKAWEVLPVDDFDPDDIDENIVNPFLVIWYEYEGRNYGRGKNYFRDMAKTAFNDFVKKEFTS